MGIAGAMEEQGWWVANQVSIILVGTPLPQTPGAPQEEAGPSTSAQQGANTCADAIRMAALMCNEVCTQNGAFMRSRRCTR